MASALVGTLKYGRTALASSPVSYFNIRRLARRQSLLSASAESPLFQR
ncbi:MAG TPA: hypothetical protein VGB68_12285 [Pyrinomonadaceae bacterium]